MEAKDALIKIVNALLEIEQPLPRQTLTDYLTGKDTRTIIDLHLEDKETFGIGDMHDEDYWTTVIDAAYEQGYLRDKSPKSDLVTLTAAAKKFLKKPTSFYIAEEDEPTENMTSDTGLDVLVQMAQNDRVTTEQVASPHTKQQIKLIKAVDRKIALDDFAENEGIPFDEVLNDLETLVRQRRRLDITYFTDEVLGQDCMDELFTFFKTKKKNPIEAASKELGDVYNGEEIRLAYIVHLMNNMK